MPQMGGQRRLVLVYTEAFALRVCDAVSRGMTIHQILKSPHMPSYKTLFDWLDRYPDFAGMYACACLVRAEALADEIVAIADGCLDEPGPEGDRVVGQGGAPLTLRARREQARIDRAKIKRAKLQIAIRKHLFAVLTPKRYRWEWMEG